MRQPKFCKHKASGQAFVTLDGKVIYLGKHDSPAAREAYDRLILKWRQANDSTGKHATTVGQLCLAYHRHAEMFYRDEAKNYQKSLKILIENFRSIPCSEFGPLKLQQLQNEMCKKHVRSQVNKSISRVKAVFRWGVSQEMVPADIMMALDCVRGLQKGRSVAKMSKNVAAICRMLILTGARVSEIRLMRVGDIDTSGKVWLYRPGSHKNAWRGKDRTIFIGPRAQAVLMPFIADAVHSDLFVFRPREENEPYTLKGLGGSVRKSCIRAKVDHWSPGQLS